MIDTGGYVIKFYDRYGRPLKDFTCHRSSYVDALKLGSRFVGISGRVSYTVDRRLFNSMDKEERDRVRL